MGREDTERGPAWDPWAAIPAEYNLGAALTAGQVRRGHGDRPALLWEDAAGRRASFTYAQLDALSGRFAAALAARDPGLERVLGAWRDGRLTAAQAAAAMLRLLAEVPSTAP